MHHIPVHATLRFDLSHYKTGAFSSDLEVGGFDGTSLNSFTVPMGLVMIKRGTVQSATAHVEGDNYKGSSKVLLLYNDLHITPLKADKENSKGFKKKSLTSLVANSLIIKDQNPSKGESPRTSSGVYDRKGQGTFFNMLWRTAFVSILKTLGIPEKFAYK
jgi:hypothetical protein